MGSLTCPAISLPCSLACAVAAAAGSTDAKCTQLDRIIDNTVAALAPQALHVIPDISIILTLALLGYTIEWMGDQLVRLASDSTNLDERPGRVRACLRGSWSSSGPVPCSPFVREGERHAAFCVDAFVFGVISFGTSGPMQREHRTTIGCQRNSGAAAFRCSRHKLAICIHSSFHLRRSLTTD